MWRTLALGVLVVGCAPPAQDVGWHVDSPRLIAVVFEPPEVAPGQSATATAVVVTPDGPDTARPVRWSVCAAPPPPSQLEPAPVPCLVAAGLAPPSAQVVTVSVPADACATFGPQVSAAVDRPRQPDVTGGHHLPVAVELDKGEVAVGFLRLTCLPAGLSAPALARFRAGARPNMAPAASLALQGELAVVEASPPERYLAVDPLSFALVERTERLTVRTFATGGALEVAGAEPGTPVRWTGRPGGAWLWAVVRDDRGGATVLTGRAP